MEKYNRTITGVITGVVVPVLALVVTYLAGSDGTSFFSFLRKLALHRVLTNAVSVAVFINVFVFLLFNRLDMLRASRGILGITIIWAILVFILKFA